MGNLKEFSLPIKGLKNGVHEYDFAIGSDFFKNFESSPVEEGNFNVHLTLDKRDSFFELSFDIDGTIRTECDRCTATIDLPVVDSQYLTVKYSIEEKEEDAEIAYITHDTSEFNVAKYIYEYISLAVPFHKAYDCENDDPMPCDFDVLNRINPTPLESESEPIDKKKNPFDDLKGLFNSDN
jgi:uncharacterized protein